MELETTAVQASLLLRCGDVESNPGPLTREGKIQIFLNGQATHSLSVMGGHQKST